MIFIIFILFLLLILADRHWKLVLLKPKRWNTIMNTYIRVTDTSLYSIENSFS